MTPEQKIDRYKKVHAMVYQLERHLNAGMSGDRVARALNDIFEEIPHPLRDTLARAGCGPAMARLQGAEGPIADCVDRMFRRCKEDPNYKRRLQEFWECMDDARSSGIEDGEDAEHTPGEVDDENEVAVRVGGTRGPAPARDGGQVAEAPGLEKAGGPVEEYVFPGSRDEEQPQIAVPENEIEDAEAGQYGDEGEGDDGSGV